MPPTCRWARGSPALVSPVSPSPGVSNVTTSPQSLGIWTEGCPQPRLLMSPSPGVTDVTVSLPGSVTWHEGCPQPRSVVSPLSPTLGVTAVTTFPQDLGHRGLSPIPAVTPRPREAQGRRRGGVPPPTSPRPPLSPAGLGGVGGGAGEGHGGAGAGGGRRGGRRAARGAERAAAPAEPRGALPLAEGDHR